MRSQLSFEPHPFIRPPSRSRVYLCPFRGLLCQKATVNWFIMSEMHHAWVYYVRRPPCTGLLCQKCTMHGFIMSEGHRALVYYVRRPPWTGLLCQKCTMHGFIMSEVHHWFIMSEGHHWFIMSTQKQATLEMNPGPTDHESHTLLASLVKRTKQSI